MVAHGIAVPAIHRTIELYVAATEVAERGISHKGLRLEDVNRQLDLFIQVRVLLELGCNWIYLI